MATIKASSKSSSARGSKSKCWAKLKYQPSSSVPINLGDIISVLPGAVMSGATGGDGWEMMSCGGVGSVVGAEVGGIGGWEEAEFINCATGATNTFANCYLAPPLRCSLVVCALGPLCHLGNLHLEQYFSTMPSILV